MEVAFGVAGLVVAWKNIVGFGELVIKLFEDDSGQREELFDKLRVSQYALKDWGRVWGIDRNDGKFHDFEQERKELIMSIIFRMEETRGKALKKLKSRYGLASGEGPPDDKGKGPSNRRIVDFDDLFSKMRNRTRATVQRGRWLARDKDVIASLVKETLGLQEDLQHLTHGSQSFIIDKLYDFLLEGERSKTADAASLSSHSLEFHRRHGSPELQTEDSEKVPQGSSPHHLGPLDIESDTPTLASYAVKSIRSSVQATRVHRLIEVAFESRGDSRMLRTVSEWWNENNSDILVVEAPDMPDDISSTSVSAMLYYLAACHKMIYSFDSSSTGDPVQTFSGMLRSFIRSIVTLQVHQSVDATTVPPGLGVLDDRACSMSDLVNCIDGFHNVLRSFIAQSDKRVLIIVDGFDQVADAPTDLAPLVGAFVTGLRELCRTARLGDKIAPPLVFLVFKGHATSLYELEAEGLCISDFTAFSGQSVGIREYMELELCNLG